MKNLMLPLLLIFILNVSAQKVKKVEKVSDYTTYVKGNNFEGVIFSEKYINMLSKVNGKKFTPGTNDILIVEKLLPLGLDTIKDATNHKFFVKNHLKKYLRQYFGYIDKNGDKIIYINVFWDNSENKSEKRWLNDIIEVLDGGDYFWQIKVNLTTHQLFDFAVNGEA